VDFRILVRDAPASWAASNAAASSTGSDVAPVTAAVGDHHVQVLPGLVLGPAGVQHARHLGQPDLDRGCQPTMPSTTRNRPPPAA